MNKHTGTHMHKEVLSRKIKCLRNKIKRRQNAFWEKMAHIDKVCIWVELRITIKEIFSLSRKLLTVYCRGTQYILYPASHIYLCKSAPASKRMLRLKIWVKYSTLFSVKKSAWNLHVINHNMPTLSLIKIHWNSGFCPLRKKRVQEAWHNSRGVM